jgi:DNA primase
VSAVTEEIRARVDLVELIGRTVQLKRVGSQFRGLCPFHTEKTPSFYVRPQTQTYHCFGCDKSGSAFDWLMEREHLEFGEALRTLAQMTGVALPERTPQAEDETRRLHSALERAQTFYAAALFGTAGARGREYFARRGLTEETLRSFGLGYAPPGNALLSYLERDGFGEQELQAAGVIGTTDEGRTYDFFRDRVLFPIRDTQGRTIAFGGRSLDDASTPKYLNSRDTLLFHKHETLFALDLARKSLAQERQVVIVEGYMDAAMAHQHGYRNVVATLGTAVTDRHLRQLRRQVDEIVLALDADAAGQAATWRALQVAEHSLRSGLAPVVGPNRRQQQFVADRAVSLRVLALPNAKDPDELIRSDPSAWPTLVRGAVPVIDFVLQRLEVRHDLRTARGKAAAAEEIADVLAGIASPIEQDHYTNEVATRLKVEPAAVRRLLKGKRQRREAPGAPTPTEVRGDQRDDYLLALLMRLRELPEPMPYQGELDFILSESRELFRLLEDPPPPPHLEPFAARARRWLPDARRLKPDQLHTEIDDTLLRIRQEKLMREKRQVSALLEEGAIDRAEAERLLDPARQQLWEVARRLPHERERAGIR